MSDQIATQEAHRSPRAKRVDAQRNAQSLLEAAAEVFVTAGVDAPVRDIAAHAGVGVATLYRHFPTRADLVVAVYRHQVEACADAGSALLATSSTPYAALYQWIDLFLDFLVTKHGLAKMLRPDSEGYATLHTYFLGRLRPTCGQLLDAAATTGEIRTDVNPYEIMRAVGNLCVESGQDPAYDPRRMVRILIAGLAAPAETHPN